MGTGAVTSYIDVAQIAIWVFLLFFAGLVYYLRTEDKREGYPLLSDRGERVKVQGFPPMPEPKTYIVDHPEHLNLDRAERTIAAEPSAPWPGAPLEPTGNPMVDGVGPAAWASRADVPDLAYDDGQPKIIPLRVAGEFAVDPDSRNPVGFQVLGADGEAAGTVTDIWLDRAEYIFRYLEVQLTGGKVVLLPVNFSVIDNKAGVVRVKSILASQFADVPTLRNPDQITLLEEDKVVAYYGGGTMYATSSRSEPLL